jgi:lipopolysaccharide export system protein LptA
LKTRFVTIIFLFSLLALQGETYSFSGDSSFSVMRAGEEVTTIEGDVSILSKSKEIYADSISISGLEEPEFSGNGNVRVKDLDKNFDMKAQEFTYSSSGGILRAKGDVRMEDGENDLFIRCQILSVQEEKNQVVMEIGVRLFKDDIICRSQYALYIREENLLELTGSPIVYKGDDLYRADRIRVNLETDEITMTGRIEGSLLSGDDESSDDENLEDIIENSGEGPMADPVQGVDESEGPDGPDESEDVSDVDSLSESEGEQL